MGCFSSRNKELEGPIRPQGLPTTAQGKKDSPSKNQPGNSSSIVNTESKGDHKKSSNQEGKQSKNLNDEEHKQIPTKPNSLIEKPNKVSSQVPKKPEIPESLLIQEVDNWLNTIYSSSKTKIILA
ncbi:hypothetical protein SteCoe_35702 [Stentor coeruleus]|uniref:Uncharacterized protein n=1 Tax=Stentor coeruleus TaxID=5963 RepID=A0A1R2ARP4_9CILI|nr:hypothetical protein SteCoe_35702 [Stentor coeruleus]